MQTCFVIQPFDADTFDKRYEEVFAPAIRDAALEPYRVDEDPNVDVPIEAIEGGIQKAAVCLADITTDNPNVWYELGFAIASRRPVVMVCSDERTGKKYPFDIQHRSIINYKTQSLSDFQNLRTGITKRIQALLKKSETARAIEASEQIAPVEGLTQVELIVLSAIASSATTPNEAVPAYSTKEQVYRLGFTSIGYSLGLQRLKKRGFVYVHEGSDINGQPLYEISITSDAWEWIERNEEKFSLRQQSVPEPDPEVPF